MTFPHELHHSTAIFLSRSPESLRICGKRNVTIWRPSVCLSIPSAYSAWLTRRQHATRPAYTSARHKGYRHTCLLCDGLVYVYMPTGLSVHQLSPLLLTESDTCTSSSLFIAPATTETHHQDTFRRSRLSLHCTCCLELSEQLHCR